jgi:hypothetical protein
MPFLTESVSVSTSDGRNFTLLTPLVFQCADGRMFRAMIGATTDGASTPQVGWNLIPPFGAYWRAAVLHDAAYRCALEQQQVNATWVRVMLPKDQADALLLEAMESCGVDFATRETIYEAVTKLGDNAWLGDAAQPIPPTETGA